MAFGLAALLRMRRLKEERTAYDMVRSRSRASELASERHQLLDQLTDHGHDAKDVRGIAAISAARASSATMLADLKALAISQQLLVEEAEQRHRAARREVRTVEKLEERYVAEQRVAELHAEQTVLDEVAGRRRLHDADEGES